ncbi:FkbM family methyltransferase [Belnapia sp. T6]|uniref:FkbM family methyltransferase n=1 Tax=Belnapia mucosa TaxID=2804532 RepID=A0ABS1V7X1_9PROT|nr:FkbM family methyltransferase [Belnapia mucosa]MBL6457462.1 FkbM family methyltransferase [Belnapia mucosa]
MPTDDWIDLLTLDDLIGNHDRTRLEAAMRRRCHTVPVDPHTILCRILGRYKFFVDCRDRGLAPHLMLDGYWEYWVSDFIWRNVRPGGTVLDVGANLGYYTVLMAELVGAGGNVFAFEPNPRLFDLLKRNVDINGFTTRTECMPKAVTGRSGEILHFRAKTTDPKNGALLPPLATGETLPDVVELKVESLALDDLPTGPVDFAKIDVEGAEEDLWAGMQGLIARSPDIQILLEFNPLRCREPQQMLAQMSALFPLRQLDDDAVVRPTEPDRILGTREDTMLYLSRLEPIDFANRRG